MNISQFAPYGMALPAIREQQQYMQQQQAMKIAAQRMAQMQAQGQQPGFAAMPPQGANAGMPMQMPPGAITGPNGAPLPPQGGTGMPPGATTGPNGAPLPAVMPFSPGAQQMPSGDPFSYPQMMQAFFGGGGSKGPEDFLAWQDAEKTVRPYGQMQGKQALETQKEGAAMDRTKAQVGSREWIAGMQESGRNSRFYVTEKNKVQQMSNVNLRALVTSTSQQLANGVDDPTGKLAGTFAAAADELKNRAGVAGVKSEFSDVPTTPSASGGSPPAGSVPVPPEAKDQPDGATATDAKGNKWVKQGAYMVPAGK